MILGVMDGTAYYLTLVDSDGYTVVNFTFETGSTGTTSFTLPFTPPANALVWLQFLI